MSVKKLLFIACLLLCSRRFGLADSVKIAIDVGHSRIFPGAISARGKPEFEFNVDLAQSLQRVLDARRIDSFLIGADGRMVELKQRAAKANANRAELLLSIHHDSAQEKYLKRWKWRNSEFSYSDDFSGFSLFVSHKNPYPEQSLDCARLLGESLKAAGFRSSNHHAEPIRGENRLWADQDFGVYYHDDLVVLKEAQMPAVLVEAGIIINRDDEQKLQMDSIRTLIASALAQGLQNCLKPHSG
ncbi:N-acetylmuramoyl-L-alanine amidase family protein [Methylomonas sp. MgM2]